MPRLSSITGPLAGAGRAVGRRACEDAVAIAPAALFFLIGFGLILLIIKLFIASYSIQLRVLSNTIIGALIAAKVSLILDRLDWARSHGYPRAAVVAGKVMVYSLCAIVLGIAEHLVEGWRRSGSLAGSLRLFELHFNPSHFFAIVLCVAMLFAVFFTMQEVSRRLGAGQMYALFFERPRA
jgi:hypothetical protein